MNKRLICSAAILFVLCGCSVNNKEEEKTISGCDIFSECENTIEAGVSNMTIKEAYEYYNGKTNSSGKEYRTVHLPEDHALVKMSPEDIVRMIENNEKFYVYIGDEKCPWCRSVIEKAIEVAKDNAVDKIYYLKIWDDEGNEILRDKFVYEDGSLVMDTVASDAYYQLLDYWKDYLSDYTLNVDGQTIEVGEKRIYAPNFVCIKDGEIRSLVTGISDKQSDSYQNLSEEILKDEEAIFEEFFALK